MVIEFESDPLDDNMIYGHGKELVNKNIIESVFEEQDYSVEVESVVISELN